MKFIIPLLLLLSSCATVSLNYTCYEDGRIDILEIKDNQVIVLLHKEDFGLKARVENLSGEELLLNKAYKINYSRIDALEESEVDEVIYVCEYELIVNVQ